MQNNVKLSNYDIGTETKCHLLRRCMNVIYVADHRWGRIGFSNVNVYDVLFVHTLRARQRRDFGLGVKFNNLKCLEVIHEKEIRLTIRDILHRIKRLLDSISTGVTLIWQNYTVLFFKFIPKPFVTLTYFFRLSMLTWKKFKIQWFYIAHRQYLKFRGCNTTSGAVYWSLFHHLHLLHSYVQLSEKKRRKNVTVIITTYIITTANTFRVKLCPCA